MTYENKGAMATTIVVAASDSLNKGAANIVCTGANDDVQIQEAVDALADIGGIVQLLEGSFSGSSFIIDANGAYKVTVKGTGAGFTSSGTSYNLVGAASTISVKAGGSLQDIRVNAPAGFAGSVITVGQDIMSLQVDVLSGVVVWGPNEFTGTGILFTANAVAADQYIMHCHFGPIYIYAFEYGIRYEADEAGGHSGFLSGNIFDSIVIWRCVYGIEPTIGATSNGGATIKVLEIEPVTGTTVRGLHLTQRCRFRIPSFEYWDRIAPEIPILIDALCANNEVQGYWQPGTEEDNSTPGLNIINNLGRPLGDGIYPCSEYPLNLESFVDTDIVLPIRDPQSAIVIDVSGKRNDAGTGGALARSTQGQLGKLNLPTGGDAAQAEGMTMDGDRYAVAIVIPDFNSDNGAIKQLFGWEYDVNNYWEVRSQGDNRIFSYIVGGGGAVVNTTPARYYFSAGDILIIVYVIEGNTARVYVNGSLLGSVTNASVGNIVSDPGHICFGGLAAGAPNGMTGDLVLGASGHRVMEAGEVSTLTQQLLRMVGQDFRQFACSDLFMDVIAVSANHVVNAQALHLADPTNCVIAAQPDVPRTLSWAFTHPTLTNYTMTVIGVNAKGDTVTEDWEETSGWTGETSNAFATITSIEVKDMTGAALGDILDVGITDVLGLSNVIYATSDVYKIKKNAANAVVAAAQVNVIYDTYDMAVIGLAVNDDFTIWYRSNLNVIS